MTTPTSIATAPGPDLLAALRLVALGPVARDTKRNGIPCAIASEMLRLDYITATLKTVRGPVTQMAILAFAITPAGRRALAAFDPLPCGSEAA